MFFPGVEQGAARGRGLRPASRIYDRDYKAAAYLRLGVREVWRVDLLERTVYVSRQGGPVDAPHIERLPWHPAEMPGSFELDVRTLFR